MEGKMLLSSSSLDQLKSTQDGVVAETATLILQQLEDSELGMEPLRYSSLSGSHCCPQQMHAAQEEIHHDARAGLVEVEVERENSGMKTRTPESIISSSRLLVTSKDWRENFLPRHFLGLEEPALDTPSPKVALQVLGEAQLISGPEINARKVREIQAHVSRVVRAVGEFKSRQQSRRIMETEPKMLTVLPGVTAADNNREATTWVDAEDAEDAQHFVGKGRGLTSSKDRRPGNLGGTESGSLADGTVTVSRLTALTKEMASLRETAQAARLTILKLRSMLPLQPSADNKPPQDEAQDKANDQLQAQTLDKAPLSVVAKYEEQRSEAGDDAGVKLDRHLLRVLEIPMEQHGKGPAHEQRTGMLKKEHVPLKGGPTGQMSVGDMRRLVDQTSRRDQALDRQGHEDQQDSDCRQSLDDFGAHGERVYSDNSGVMTPNGSIKSTTYNLPSSLEVTSGKSAHELHFETVQALDAAGHVSNSAAAWQRLVEAGEAEINFGGDIVLPDGSLADKPSPWFMQQLLVSAAHARKTHRTPPAAPSLPPAVAVRHFGAGTETATVLEKSAPEKIVGSAPAGRVDWDRFYSQSLQSVLQKNGAGDVQAKETITQTIQAMQDLQKSIKRPCSEAQIDTADDNGEDKVGGTIQEQDHHVVDTMLELSRAAGQRANETLKTAEMNESAAFFNQLKSSTSSLLPLGVPVPFHLKQDQQLHNALNGELVGGERQVPKHVSFSDDLSGIGGSVKMLMHASIDDFSINSSLHSVQNSLYERPPKEQQPLPTEHQALEMDAGLQVQFANQGTTSQQMEIDALESRKESLLRSLSLEREMKARDANEGRVGNQYIDLCENLEEEKDDDEWSDSAGFASEDESLFDGYRGDSGLMTEVDIHLAEAGRAQLEIHAEALERQRFTDAVNSAYYTEPDFIKSQLSNTNDLIRHLRGRSVWEKGGGQEMGSKAGGHPASGQSKSHSEAQSHECIGIEHYLQVLRSKNIIPHVVSTHEAIDGFHRQAAAQPPATQHKETTLSLAQFQRLLQRLLSGKHRPAPSSQHSRTRGAAYHATDGAPDLRPARPRGQAFESVSHDAVRAGFDPTVPAASREEFVDSVDGFGRVRAYKAGVDGYHGSPTVPYTSLGNGETEAGMPSTRLAQFGLRDTSHLWHQPKGQAPPEGQFEATRQAHGFAIC